MYIYNPQDPHPINSTTQNLPLRQPEAVRVLFAQVMGLHRFGCDKQTAEHIEQITDDVNATAQIMTDADLAVTK